VRAESYDEDKTSLAWEDLIENPDQVAAQIAALAPVTVATPRLFASGIVRVGDDSVGVRVVGIDPASVANAPYREGLLSGEFLEAEDREGVLIGRPLAVKMSLAAGDSIDLLVNTSNGDVDEQLFVVLASSQPRRPPMRPRSSCAAKPGLTQAENHASTIFVMLQDRPDGGGCRR
jgi:ABC-type lipoprotein release transport system permease subunit